VYWWILHKQLCCVCSSENSFKIIVGHIKWSPCKLMVLDHFLTISKAFVWLREGAFSIVIDIMHWNIILFVISCALYRIWHQYSEDMWGRYYSLTSFFSDCWYVPYLQRYSLTKLCNGAQMANFSRFFASCTFSVLHAALACCVVAWQEGRQNRKTCAIYLEEQRTFPDH